MMLASLVGALLIPAASAAVGIMLWRQDRRISAAVLAMPAAWGVWVATRIPPLFDALATRAAADPAVRYPPVWPLVLALCVGSVMAVWFVATMLTVALSYDDSSEAAWIPPVVPDAETPTPGDQ